MSNEVDEYIIPISSNDLCFDGNAFIKPNFSADRFLQEHRGRASLEAMRDDLGSYLKVLRSATLDLIDQEYADFVGLSSSLVGLDKAVGKIRDPLGQLREEVMTVKSSLEEAVKGIKTQLEVRRSLRERRVKLEALSQALTSLQRLEGSLGDEAQIKKYQDRASQKLPIAERAAAEFNHLQFCLEKCDSADQLKLRTKVVHDQLLRLLGDMLLSNLQAVVGEGGEESAVDAQHVLERLLRIYASLNWCSAAEDLIGECIVAPALDSVIKAPSSKSGGRSGQWNLSEMYSRVLGIVDEKLGRFFDLTTEGNRHSSVKGFDFLAHSLWPHFVKKLKTHLPNIYAPGNPDLFHQRFTETMEFLEGLEKSCRSSDGVVRLRAHPSYKPFITSWNLPVYFQIRFQEVAGSLEAVLPLPPYPSNGFDASSLEELIGLKGKHPSHEGFWLLQTSTAWDCIVHCWDTKVFIMQLSHRFWKMNLQFVARFCQWSKDILEHQLKSVKDQVSNQSGESGDELTGADVGVVSQQSPSLSVVLLLPLCLHRDISQLSLRLQETLLPLVVSRVVPPMRDQGSSQDVRELLQRSLSDGIKALADIEPLATQCIVRVVSQGSLPHLRQCRDIPRFYRRTNRIHPSRPRPYVSSALATPLHFRTLVLSSFSAISSGAQGQTMGPWVNTSLLDQWMEKIFSEVTVQYYADVSEVLTSVQKMEESLRRLKRIKGVGGRGSEERSVDSPSTDDDDKIRAQLALDVQHFCQQVESTGLGRGRIKKLPQLVELVDNAINKDRS